MGWFYDRLNAVANAISRKHAALEAAKPPKWLTDAADTAWDAVPEATKKLVIDYIGKMAKKYGAEYAKTILRNMMKALTAALNKDDNK